MRGVWEAVQAQSQRTVRRPGFEVCDVEIARSNCLLRERHQEAGASTLRASTIFQSGPTFSQRVLSSSAAVSWE